MRRLMLGLVAVTMAAGLVACKPAADTPVSAGQGPAAGESLPVPTPAVEPSATPEPSVEPSVAPSPSVSPTRKPTAKPAGTCPLGDNHGEVETALNKLGGYGALTADGKQSASDCTAIKKFQTRFGISPSNGRAGPLTASVAKRLLASAPSRCGAGSGLTACVDLTNQTTWIMDGGKVVYGPTVTRTGMKNYATHTGEFKINVRREVEWSDKWEVNLKKWQHFVDGMGFHETTTYIHNGSIGSHGCVNLLRPDAVKYYDLLAYNVPVRVFGKRPGT